MKNILSFLIFTITSITSAQNWETNWDDAILKAENNNLNIVLVFSGSDWCAPCIKLDKEIWSTSTFQTLAKDHFIMLRADFPRKNKNALSKVIQEQNATLAEKYNKKGYFPYVAVLNPKGNVLGSLGYKKTTPELYFKSLQAFEK
ncbi:thioredoxin family protein [uncultured Formosa sp.]|uniref:thioredoxin family protein n=1 Tax=uncultured Formosa sp. TaxID=255435 RepID=UPI0026377F56|nr:thioredoxin family protein [uncultured Formosa sp.]